MENVRPLQDAQLTLRPPLQSARPYPINVYQTGLHALKPRPVTNTHQPNVPQPLTSMAVLVKSMKPQETAETTIAVKQIQLRLLMIYVTDLQQTVSLQVQDVLLS